MPVQSAEEITGGSHARRPQPSARIGPRALDASIFSSLALGSLPRAEIPKTFKELPPILLWFRRDFRLADHPALHAAAATGRPIIPVVLCDEVVEALGAAPRMRWGMAVEAFGRRLATRDSRLTLRRGNAAEALAALAREVGAGSVWWTRVHDGASRRRDRRVRDALERMGIDTRVFPRHLLHEPDEVQSGAGTPFKIYTPFFRAIRGRDISSGLPEPKVLRRPERWPASEELEAWELGRRMHRGRNIVASWQSPGEDAARDCLDQFIAQSLEFYSSGRDRPDQSVTSGLSEHLALGEISPRTCWRACLRAFEEGCPRTESFLRELAYRDFAAHLLWHFPTLATEAWKRDWSSFPWHNDPTSPALLAWQQGRTGYSLVDAGMRELFVTGRMHNRVRMVVASFLTKHLLIDWRLRLAWFEDCLTDWDPASNAMNWQLVAGSGPDAAPLFRIFNPDTQAKTYDPLGHYRRTWIAEGVTSPWECALSFFEAAPPSWGLLPDQPYPDPIIDLAQGRARALATFQQHGRRQPA